MLKKTYNFLLLTFFVGLFAFGQSEIDSSTTAFRKGRWLTGLSGSISSTKTQFDNSSNESTTNNFGINIQTGRFVKDRWLVGGRFQINKINSSGNIEQTTETLFIGPFSNYYFSRSKSGSLFASAALGYTRFSNEATITQQLITAKETAEGGGLGTFLGLGYSYTITDSVAFDLGVNVNLFWVNVNQESFQANASTSANVSSTDISFTFGFNVILDDFFF